MRECSRPNAPTVRNKRRPLDQVRGIPARVDACGSSRDSISCSTQAHPRALFQASGKAMRTLLVRLRRLLKVSQAIIRSAQATVALGPIRLQLNALRRASRQDASSSDGSGTVMSQHPSVKPQQVPSLETSRAGTPHFQPYTSTQSQSHGPLHPFMRDSHWIATLC